MKAISPKTVLKDRILWSDGDSTVTDIYIIEAVSSGRPIDGLFVEQLTDDIIQYNKLVDPDQEIRVKKAAETPNLEFSLPDGYSDLDVEEFIATRLSLELKQLKHEGIEHTDRMKRVNTIARELRLYEDLGLFDVLRTLIFVINTLQDKSIVWGVGRGSCVASYVLYLIGVHDVDSVQYDLDIKEFLRT